MSDIEYSVITSDVIKSFDCTLSILISIFVVSLLISRNKMAKFSISQEKNQKKTLI